MLDENNPFNNKIKTDDMYIEDNLLDDTDSKDIKKFLMVSSKKKIWVTILKFHLIISDRRWTKKKKKIPNTNSVSLASNRIIKKY